MKILRTILTIILLVFVAQCFAQSASAANIKLDKSKSNSTIEWTSIIHDFGDIEFNVPVTADFEFENISKEPLAIINVKSSCGCTVPEYSRDPVLPEQTATISATYNAKREGVFQKSVTVTLSDNSQHRLLLKGVVVSKEN
jgi:hypothetical protein